MDLSEIMYFDSGSSFLSTGIIVDTIRSLSTRIKVDLYILCWECN